MTMAIKKRILLIALVLSIIVLPVCLIILSHTTNSIKYQEIRIPASHKMYRDANELQERSDLIIVGKMEKDFFEFTPTVKYNADGRYEDYYTVTDVKIVKLLKGEYSKDIVPVIQSAALIDSSDKKQKKLLISEGYSVMEKGKKYILFLKKTELEGIYGIISINQGKFNIDNLDTKEKELVEKDEQLKNLRQSVLEKYKDKLN